MLARGRSRRRLLAVVLAAGLAVGLAPAGASGADGEPGGDRLYLVTLDSPGLAGRPGARDASADERGTLRARLLERQDATLAQVGSPEPTYRWTTALNGYAVRLDPARADRLRGVRAVARVERNTVRRLAGSPGGAGRPGPPVPGSRGGDGVVVGVVDSGLFPENPLFAPLRDGGRTRGFRGECVEGPGWPASTCSSKIVGARWFVDGFGRDRLRSTSRLSPRDDLGHGTQVASVVGGDADVSIRVRGRHAGRYRGVAPQSRLAVYKACWAAPDPADDGCATADLVTAVDRAVTDRVDVLALPVGGPARSDTLERAMLGAAEADVAVVAASGNGGAGTAPAHGSAWVTTVGSALGPLRAGRVQLAGGPTLRGAMVARQGVGPARLVRGSDVAAEGSRPAAAALCRPGSLDAARAAGAVVVCERGRIGRVEKSAAVARADGVGMVLTQANAGALTTDFHRVPTVHLDRRASAALDRWLGGRTDARASLRPAAKDLDRGRLAASTPTGDPARGSVKPDLVAPGTGVLGAVPPGPTGDRWDFFSGSSAATATTAGVVAALRAAHPDWSAARVRSAVATSASPLAGERVLRQGSGLLRPRAARRPGLVLDMPAREWRRTGAGSRANTTSITLAAPGSRTRTLTRVGGRALYFSSRVEGLDPARVRVRPAALRLSPGESAEFTVTLRGPGPRDAGYVVWRGADGTKVRVPVAVGGR